MRVMDVLKKIKAGAHVMVTLPERKGAGKKYNLTDGTDVSAAQFSSIQDFLSPVDGGLFGDEPQAYRWSS